MITVNEAHIAQAVLRLIEEDKCVVEGAGAVGVAAALAGRNSLINLSLIFI